MIQSAHVIGMGRLGRHLSDRLEMLGVGVTRWNRTPLPHARPLDAWAPDGADAIFLTVSDDALPELAHMVSAQLPDSTWLIHHAGSVPKDILGARTRKAVLWPPMTFQPESAPDWETLPLAIDAEDNEWSHWCRNLTPAAFDVTEAQRRHLHLGAVLMGNLTAAWIGMVQTHLTSKGLSPELLNPLVEVSVAKALEGHALDTVTGPAVRNDRATLEAQHHLLSDSDPDVLDLHHRLTQRILSHHGHDPLPPFQTAPRRD